MSKFDQTKALGAIREALQETVAQFGVEFVRTLSFFPSARKVEMKRAA